VRKGTTLKTKAERIMQQISARWPGNPVPESGILRSLLTTKRTSAYLGLLAGSEFIEAQGCEANSGVKLIALDGLKSLPFKI
jgi:hypothetical protein